MVRGAWLVVFGAVGLSAAEPLRLSVYATAGDVRRYLTTAEGRERAESAMRRLGVSRVFLEGRRGDEYVAPEQLRGARDYFRERGFQVAGGIATVPGKMFGARQNEKLGWLNWEDSKTQRDVAGFFRENAPIFDEIIVDDFYCRGDTSPVSEKARGARSWAQYRQDLLVGLIRPMIVEPSRPARLVIKYPQWYDRFHLFGYDPARMSQFFDRVWVGTEVRNPQTQRMGYVQPTEGYMNFRWLQAVAADKVEGAWFDHIECTAQNFVDQAYQSVLAGARELTLFHLGDVVEGHPGHALFVKALPELRKLAEQVRGRVPRGIAYYKPPSSDADENLYLMDYLGMLGLPIVPAARRPAESPVVFLGAQADPQLRWSQPVIRTPAFLRKSGGLEGIRISPHPRPGTASEVEFGGRRVPLPTPLEVDLGLEASEGVLIRAGSTPLLVKRGNALVWNVRTFSEQDYRDTGEVLLAPKPRGLPEIPQELADELRGHFLAPLGIRLSAPARVAFYLLGNRAYLYNFRDEDVEVRLNGRPLRIGANRLASYGL